MTLSRI